MAEHRLKPSNVKKEAAPEIFKSYQSPDHWKVRGVIPTLKYLLTQREYLIELVLQ